MSAVTRKPRPRRQLSAALCLALCASLLAACAEERREYPLTQEGKDLGSLSGAVGSAPPEAAGVGFERLLNARSEPHNWLTYYGAYDAQRYSPLDQINTANIERLRPAWVFQFSQFAIQASEGTFSFQAAPVVVEASCTPPRGTAGPSPSMPRPARSCGATSTRSPSTRRFAAAT